ncbi:MAG: DUF4012 domain-containing protein, partial [Candidatus Pacearchaeota archaeon]
DEIFLDYVSEKKPKITEIKKSNIFYAPFFKKFPQIPENLYSYIFIIDENESSIRESFDIFIQKARENKSPLIYITGLRNVNWSFIDLIKGEYRRLKIIIYGDIIGNNWDDETFGANDLVYHAKRDKKIKIPGDGMEKIFPVFLDDVINEIIKASFIAEESTKVFYLFSRYPQTYLSFGHILQKTDPDIKIDFIKREKQDNEVEIPSGGIYLVNNQYPLQKKLQEVEFPTENFKKNIKQKAHKGAVIKARFILKYAFLFFLTLSLLPIISALLFSFLGYLEIKNSVNMFKRGFFQKTFNASSLSWNFFEISKATANGFKFELAFFRQEQLTDPLIMNIETGIKLAKALNYLSSAGLSLRDLLDNGNKDPNMGPFEIQLLIKKGIISLQEISLENNLPLSYKKEISNFSSLIEHASIVQEIIPEILGFDTEKTYLILFQNNMEIRPGGGFIGSYGILTLNRGKITNFTINDVYDADGQLKGHVEPPFAIRRYLQKPHWYMRDSNFNPDFRHSAYAAAFFLNEEMGQKVDGVIGIDVSFLKLLLKEIGPVQVPEYNEIVNSENMYFLTQTHAEKDFFPSSTQKKDFLRSLSKGIQAKLSEKNDFPYLSVMMVVLKAIEEKHMIFSFNNSIAQNLFTVNGWSSSLWDERNLSMKEKNKKGSLLINDFLGIVEANLGVNKANFFVERKVSQDININEDGSVSSRATIVYKNNSNKWPGGDYKNYIRFVLPQNTSLSQVFIDGIPQKIGSAITDPFIYEQKTFIPPQLLEIERTEEEGKTLYGFFVTVPAKNTKTISIDYELSKNNNENFSIEYSLKYFKQPGTEIYPFNLTVNFPSSYQIVSSSNDLNINNEKAVFSKEISGDKNFIISLGRK